METLGVILAGGLSQRMGTDKAFVSFNNRRFIDIATEKLRQNGIQHIVISGQPRQDLTKTTPDLVSQIGPLGGIFSVLVTEDLTRFQQILFIPIDTPTLHNQLLQELINAPTQTASYFENSPLPLLIKTAIINDKFLALIKQGGSIKKAIDRLTPLILKTKNPIKNINTPEDLATLGESI